MSDDRLTRRQLLAGVGAVGALGAGVGVGTRAVMEESVSFPGNELTSRSLDLELRVERDRGELTDWRDATGVEVDWPVPAPGSSVRRVIALRATPCGVAQEFWVRVADAAADAAADAVELQLHKSRDCDRTATVPVTSQRPLSVAGSDPYLGGGVRLDSTCGTTPESCLTTCAVLEVATPEGSEATAFSLDLEFVAQQCTSGERRNNPWTT